MIPRENPSTSAVISWWKFPWLLLWALPSSAVLAGLITVYIAFTHQDDMVVDAYYKKGLALSRAQAPDQHALIAQLQARSVRLGNRLIVSISGFTEKTAPEHLILRLSHPTQAARDHALILQRVSHYQYETSIEDLGASRWYAELSPEDQNWRLVSEWSGDAAHLFSAKVL